MGPAMVVMVMVAPPGGPKQHRADVAFQDIKRGAVGVSGRQEYLAGHHEHGEDEDKAGFGYREPAGLLEGEEYGSVQAGLCGAGGGQPLLLWDAM